LKKPFQQVFEKLKIRKLMEAGCSLIEELDARKFRIIVNCIAWVAALVWIIPFLGVFMAAIRPYAEIQFGWWHFRPFTLDLHNFVDAWTGQTLRNNPLSTGVLYSLIVTLPATFLPIFVAALAAYSFARFSSRIKDMLFLVIVLLQTIPQQMVIIPVHALYQNYHLLSSFMGLILLHTAFGLPWQILFLRNFFATLPIEIEEAARVDGASYLKIFYKIVLPMSLPALASMISLQFIWVWNDFFFALTIIENPFLRLAPQIVPALLGRYQLDWSLLSAGSIIVMIIPVAVYAMLQRYYIRGLTAGAVKG
jgi:multiple sugar transport system permease protein